MLNDVRHASEPDDKLGPPSPPAPRVLVRQTDNGQTIEPVLGEPADLGAFRSGFIAVFGTLEEVVAEALFGQLLNGLHTEPHKPVDPAIANRPHPWTPGVTRNAGACDAKRYEAFW
jgi:hypothetical protein